MPRLNAASLLMENINLSFLFPFSIPRCPHLPYLHLFLHHSVSFQHGKTFSRELTHAMGYGLCSAILKRLAFELNFWQNLNCQPDLVNAYCFFILSSIEILPSKTCSLVVGCDILFLEVIDLSVDLWFLSLSPFCSFEVSFPQVKLKMTSLLFSGTSWIMWQSAAVKKPVRRNGQYSNKSRLKLNESRTYGNGLGCL